MHTAIDHIVETFQTLTPAGVDALQTIYAPNARFRDPFNDVQGLAAIQRIFRHMYVNLENPRFLITGRIVQGTQCFLSWEFRFAFRRFKQGQVHCIGGGSHLVLNEDGHIALHRDYWDAAELYEKLPAVGSLLRWMKRRSDL